MIDTHCHIDLYPHPTEVAAAADLAGVLTIIVTNLPSAFERALPFVGPMKNIRLALGLHPLVAEQHKAELQKFRELVDKTSYIGEIGLDFSRAGYGTKELQLESLKFVLQSLKGKPKFMTLHSRQAESAVLDLLEEERQSPIVFHWFTGALSALSRAVNQGHFFSVNPAMVNSPNGKRIIETLPKERVLTETDGPFVKIGSRSAIPSDVSLVEDYLASEWQMKPYEVRMKIKTNFFQLIRPIQLMS
jgi:TatD DNase family protein